MTNVDDTTSDESRRGQRRARRRSWRLRLLIGLLGTALVTGTAYALTGPFRPGDGKRAAARTSPTTTTTAPAHVDTADTKQQCRSPLDPSNPLRLYIGGDSLAGSLGPSLGEITGATGVVQPVFNSRVSSGLTTPDFYDWNKHAGEDLLMYNPEVAVFMIGTNDAKTMPTDSPSHDQWRAFYEQLVDHMMTLLSSNGRMVFWVGAPVTQDASLSDHIREVNDIFQSVAKRHPGVAYIDSYTLFAGNDGKFTPVLADQTGHTVQMRAGDGIHFTPDGGDRLAKAVFQQLDPICKITSQAVPGAVKQTIEVQGSSQVPGTSRDATTATTGPSRSTGTTAPRAPSNVGTAPPVTDAPTSPPSAPPPPPPPPPSSSPPTSSASTTHCSLPVCLNGGN